MCSATTPGRLSNPCIQSIESPGPATNPSRDIVQCQQTLAMRVDGFLVLGG
jgi:hypothetical protein